MMVWGLSYHVDRSVDYNEDNWGLGLRYYLKLERFFVEVRRAAQQQPWTGSAGLGFGAEFQDCAASSAGCRFLGVGALTPAYINTRTEIPPTSSWSGAGRRGRLRACQGEPHGGAAEIL